MFSRGSELLKKGSHPGLPMSDSSPPCAPWLLAACGDPSGLALNLQTLAAVTPEPQTLAAALGEQECRCGSMQTASRHLSSQ